MTINAMVCFLKKKNSSDRLSVQSAVSSNSHSSQQTEELVHVEDKLGKLPDDESTEKNQVCYLLSILSDFRHTLFL